MGRGLTKGHGKLCAQVCIQALLGQGGPVLIWLLLRPYARPA